jgi:hypothetical protein
MIHDVLVTVDKFSYHVDFVVLDMEDQSDAMILGRPFLAIAGALIDVKGAKLTLNLGQDKLVFDMKHASTIPRQPEQCSRIEVVDRSVLSLHKRTPEELKQQCLERDNEEIMDFYLVEKVEEEGESIISTESMKSAVSIKMKLLPAHL